MWIEVWRLLLWTVLLFIVIIFTLLFKSSKQSCGINTFLNKEQGALVFEWPWYKMLSHLLLPLLFHILCCRKLAAHATGKWFVAHNLSNTFGVPFCHYSETVNTGEIWDSQSDIGRFKSCVMWCCVTGCVVTDGHVRNYSPICKASYPSRLESLVQYFLCSKNVTVREIFCNFYEDWFDTHFNLQCF